MFSKAKQQQKSAQDDRRRAASTADAPPLASPQGANASPNTKRSSAMKAAGVPSIISADVVMRGNINSAGEIQFDGVLEGDIKSGSLIVGDKATVKGEIVCESVTVRGRVEGGIRAKQVVLAATAYIIGDILHSSLTIESGAHFEGNSRHSDDPLSEASASDFRKLRPSSPALSGPRPVASAPLEAPAGMHTPPANPETPSFLSQGRSPLR